MQQPDYDIVVVGSGIGGLSAGALLSHWGYKVLVVEKMSSIGGRCSTEEYQGFKLPTGSITLVYEDMEDIFKEVGAELQLVDVPRLFWRIKGKDYEMPPKGAIRTLFNIINKLEEERAKELGKLAQLIPVEKIMTAFPGAIKEPEKEAGLTFKDWLVQYTDNELVHEVFNTMTDAIPGTPYYEVSAAGVFSWFAKMGGSRQMGIASRGSIVTITHNFYRSD
jgi:phytoene dehydrogenase-like protein